MVTSSLKLINLKMNSCYICKTPTFNQYKCTFCIVTKQTIYIKPITINVIMCFSCGKHYLENSKCNCVINK